MDGIVYEDGIPGRRKYDYVPLKLPEEVAGFMADVRAARDKHGVSVDLGYYHDDGAYLEVDGFEFHGLDDVPAEGKMVFVPLTAEEREKLEKQEAKARRKAFQRSLPGVPRGRFRVEGAP